MNCVKKVSVIMPYYNEGNRIIPILEEIKKSFYVGEIIVVDDGSDPQNHSVIENTNEIKLITHSRNQGKAAALKTGFLNSRYEIIVFCDTDLVGFKSFHLDLLVKMLMEGNYDLIIGEREKELFLTRLIGMATTLGGERAVPRKIIEKHLEIFEVKGYLIESAMNKIFFKNYKVGKVLLKGVGQIWKIQKGGFFDLFTKDIKWILRYITFLGLKEFLFQLSFSKKLKFLNC